MSSFTPNAPQDTSLVLDAAPVFAAHLVVTCPRKNELRTVVGESEQMFWGICGDRDMSFRILIYSRKILFFQSTPHKDQ